MNTHTYTHSQALNRREPPLSRAGAAAICSVYGERAQKPGRGVGKAEAGSVSGDRGEPAAPAPAALLPRSRRLRTLRVTCDILPFSKDARIYK